MAKPFTLKVIKDQIPEFIADLKGFARKRARVGVFGSEASQDHGGITNAELAMVHEFGGGNVPQRSFLRSTADENERKYQRQLERSIKKLLKNPGTVNPTAELTGVGESMRTDVIRKIKSGIPPSLSEPYGSQKVADGWPSTPLIRTGQLIGAIEAIVKDA